VLVGEATYALVRDAVVAESAGPMTVKGKVEPLAAWRVMDVVPGAPGWARHLDSPLVGRDRELRVLDETFQRTLRRRTCELVTVVGDAGVGKSRLTLEFASRLGSSVRLVSGRCLPYGEGITFWPILEVLRDAAGVGELDSPEEARPKILDLLEPGTDSALIGERLAALLGLSGVAPGIQETFWAVRKLFEGLAARRPLVIVFDDIHSGEATFLDLIEYLVDWVRGAPVLILAAARPELLDIRPTWTGGKENAFLLTLAPLAEPEVDGLVRNLLRGAEIDPEAQSRIADVTEGNPLFVEELLRMLVDQGALQRSDGSWTVRGDLSSLKIPPTIQALLTARLDQLNGDERALLERASVIGRVFWWNAVDELAPEDLRPRIATGLQSLVRRELIRPEHSDLVEQDAFRFTHILIRDAAYGGIPKVTRADLHERFARWIERAMAGRAGQYEEILGYHLEQAHRALSDLRLADERVEDLGKRGAVALSSAGRRAFARGDMPAAVNLLSRASDLLTTDDPDRLRALPDLAFALLETGDLVRMQKVVDETSEAAARIGGAPLQAQAIVLRLWMRVFTDPQGWAREAHREATQAIAVFDAEGDEAGLAKAWSLLGLFHLFTCQFAESEDAWEKAAAHARAAGRQREELENLSWVPLVVYVGPRPVEDAIQRCREVYDRADGDRKAMSTALSSMAMLEAMRGRFNEARELVSRAKRILEEISLPVWLGGPTAQVAGWVELLARNAIVATRELQAGADMLREVGELSYLSTVAALLAEAEYQQGRFDQVEQHLRLSEVSGGEDDVYTQIVVRSVRAKLSAQRQEFEEAERLAREAVAMAEPTDFLFGRWYALFSLGEVLGAAGRAGDADEVLRQAAAVAERKGFTVGAERARSLLASSPA
ncbi:MAG: AAA family ATPase, partial [Actinomycetota bacterium]